MNKEQLNRILRLVNRTGDKFIIADRETDGVYVVMDMLDYEEMQGVYDEDDGADFEDDEFMDDGLPFNEPAEIQEGLGFSGEDLGGEDEMAKFSQKNDFSEDFSFVPDKKAKNIDFTEGLEEKDNFDGTHSLNEELPHILAKNSRPSYASVGQLLKNKDFFKEELVWEKINPLEEMHGIADELSAEFKEEAKDDDEELDEEDRNRFYLEPV